MGKKESKPLKNNGAFEVNDSGKVSKSSTPPDLMKDLLKRESKSWRYQLQIAEATESLDALMHSRKAKSVIPGFFEKDACLYCHKTLNPGNTSRFCNKRCMLTHAEHGPIERENNNGS